MQTIAIVIKFLLLSLVTLSTTAEPEKCNSVCNATEQPLEQSPAMTDVHFENPSKRLSRKKRYVVFPEGSSFSVAVCMTIGMYGNPNYQWISWALNWGIAYELPNETVSFKNRQKRDMPKPVVQRQNRRDLFHRLEVAMNDMGYDGRECILRAVCESSQFFKKKGDNLVEELLRITFTMPKSKVLYFEHKDLWHYDGAYRRGLSKSSCTAFYPKCSFSLLDLALGRYSKPNAINFM